MTKKRSFRHWKKRRIDTTETCNLKLLRFDPILFELNDQLKQSVYHNLEVLQINCTTISTIACIIKNSGKHLKKISTSDPENDDFYEDSLILIRAISENCPLLESLSLTFTSSKMHFIELEKLLKTCQNLKALSLNIKIINDVLSFKFNETMLESEKGLSKVMIKSAPVNLKELRLDGYYHFILSSETLKTHLENWSGRRPFSIFVSDSHYEIEEYRRL
ncbi:6642_t:CDS:2 [Funneliformis mosseae]|uniref:6642_t:CDS:1 n=1 Tax=Funneliformis mosseae TaxID=27381 RepID=A0A9N8VSF6_FUNMO|nr:6642_t:CDS:2 [Funneliformis mosseae]